MTLEPELFSCEMAFYDFERLLMLGFAACLSIEVGLKLCLYCLFQPTACRKALAVPVKSVQ